MTKAKMLALLLSVTVAGCADAALSLQDCEALCARQGQKVAEYSLGAQIPIFKPHPTVTCACK